MCGGTASQKSFSPFDRAVYPRVCGGTQVPLIHRRLSIRSIPACAGEPFPWAIRATTVYPRVCGGTYVRIGAVKENKGLSPRVRGNPAWQHPGLRRSNGIGLSPRVRGNHPDAPCAVTAGSIPACAGEPGLFWQSRRHNDKVYPRVCGGTSSCSRRSLRRVYPRVCGGTGGHRISVWHARVRRSIPACAGEPFELVGIKVRQCRRSIPACAGEPRSRQGYPLVAGEPFRPLERGSIPACAGEPIWRD